jgi:hypothetical protein
MLRVLAAAAALVASAAPAARAQMTLDTVKVIVPPFSRADSLDEKALALYSSPKKWRQAAYLHQLSASMRSLEDMRGIGSLTAAANLFYAIGDLRSARSAMESAAEHAARRGEVGKSALAYIDAGYIALELGNTGRAEQLGRKAQGMAGSPFLSDGERSTILRRVHGEGRAVALLAP